ncbi:type 2 lanthipeptide synthetase LanM [Ascidiimonas sp. W6]|uniref:type 2 lanthipeptide synthetase LanM family protein n=1 Tax=Ascidiimonas meishanensis TaxID=3128903 RepID=UPI0030EC9DF6
MKKTVEKKDHLFIDFQTHHFQTGLLNFCLPLINKTIQKLNATQKTCFTDLFVKSHKVVIHNLLENLLFLSLKTLIANYKILKKEGVFTEETELEQLESFNNHLKEPEIRNYLLEQYPLLEKWLVNEAQVWLMQTQTLAVRLEKDINSIRNEFFEGDELGFIERITFGLGDRHRGGKTVALIEFESNKKLIYKPRNLSIDYHFSEFLLKLDEQLGIGFKTPKTIRHESYGWVEFIENTSCTTKKEINNYYFRKGAYLAILYALEATDFHYENIISHGEYPVLIDLESFFHPYFPMLGTETNQAISNSVLRTGILPSTISADDDEIDISGLTDVENKESILSNMVLQINDGNLEYVRDKGILKGGKNIALLNGKKAPIGSEHLPHFKEGFKKVYLFLYNNKEYIKSQLSYFADDEVRVLFRNTVAYVHLLEESTHPNVLESEEEAKKHFQVLRERIKTYQLAKIFTPHEEASLLKREIPLFTTKVNSKHLWYEDDQYLENFFENTGENTVFQKIDTLSIQDLKRQLWIIDASFSISKSPNQNTKHYKRLNPNLNLNIPDNEELLAQSIKVADYIIDSINCNEEICNWLVFKATDLEGKKYRIAEASYDLFTGMPGEILFFAYLHEVTRKEEYKNIALRALRYLDKKISEAQNSIKVLGLYAGWGSIINLYTKIGLLWGKEIYFKKIEVYFNTINFEDLIQKDKDYSILKGNAGFIIACANYYEHSKSNKAAFFAKKAGDYLLSKAIYKSDFIAWKIVSKVPLSGLAHGSSGFALAFSKLYTITKDENHITVLQSILNYEKRLYIKDQNNWQDCRDAITLSYPNETICCTAWSHGAPGIGIARLSLLKSNLSIPNLKKEIEIAIETTVKQGFGGNQSLSFGDFGNLELLHEYYLYFDDKEIRKKLDTILRLLIESIDEKGWHIGSKSIYSMGVMTGITGIGYQFLRIAYPTIVPSILNGD